MSNTTAAQPSSITPRFIRARDVYGYLGMCRPEFEKTVRPHVREFQIGKQGIAFDRHEIDEWADAYIHAWRLIRQSIKTTIGLAASAISKHQEQLHGPTSNHRTPENAERHLED